MKKLETVLTHWGEAFSAEEVLHHARHGERFKGGDVVQNIYSSEKGKVKGWIFHDSHWFLVVTTDDGSTYPISDWRVGRWVKITIRGKCKNFLRTIFAVYMPAWLIKVLLFVVLGLVVYIGIEVALYSKF